jgi:SpoVK/Ycf46/Vps4 family AAA+-type ATPase
VGPAAGYTDGREHLLAALGRVDLLLRLAVARRRRDPAAVEFNDLRGLYISEEEIRRLCEPVPPPVPRSDERLDEDENLLAALALAEEDLEQRTAAALAAGVRLPLAELAERFALSPFDVDALLLCLAPELDNRCEKLYAYLQDDVTRRRPTAGLILSLLAPSRGERLALHARLAAGAPLLRHGLLAWAAAENEAPFPSRPLRLDDRIVHFLLGLDLPDERLAPFARRAVPRAPLSEVMLPAGLGPEALRARTGGGPTRLVFQGEPGAGRRLAAEALCAEAGLGLLEVDTPALLAQGSEVRALASRLPREATLLGCAVYLDGAEALLDEPAAQAARELLGALEGFPGVLVLGATRSWSAGRLGEPALLRVDFPPPGPAQRRALWRAAVRRHGLAATTEAGLDALAERFAFNAGSIDRAVAEAACRAGADPGAGDLDRACRAQTGSVLATLARKIPALSTWDDLVLPADRLAQLRELCAHVEHRRQVFEGWGFERKIARGKGIAALFAGPSGAGKTLAAEILAGELGLELYRIDLSAIVSKYIGETEKNLARIFTAAEEGHAVLFFDEADAIFGKRSQVKDAHDRYANIEINYLLQRLEEHPGVVILASNFRKNIDEAFTRRLRFVIELPLPDENLRRDLWRKLFPPEVPLAAGVDFEFLAQRFKITGGSIRNIALHAAFLAAAAGAPVGMEHVLRSTRRELAKSGHLCLRADFEPYADLAGEEP